MDTAMKQWLITLLGGMCCFVVTVHRMSGMQGRHLSTLAASGPVRAF